MDILCQLTKSEPTELVVVNWRMEYPKRVRVYPRAYASEVLGFKLYQSDLNRLTNRLPLGLHLEPSEILSTHPNIQNENQLAGSKAERQGFDGRDFA
jgi:hypothetical protein